MQIPNQQNRPFTGANMTPMIDVVFLLIIFFLVSSHLARQESRLPVELPSAATHDSIDTSPVSLTITINADRQVLASGREINETDLVRLFESVVAKDGDASSLRIRTDGVVPYSIVEPLLRSSARAGILDIKLAVKDLSGNRAR